MYFPVELPGYVGDLDGVCNTIAAFAVRGPYIYLRLSIDPAFDKVRDHPRYLAPKAAYEAWAAN